MDLVEARLACVTQFMLERRLTEVSKRLARAREELAVVDEQARALADAADDARVRALVSETPLAARESQEASRHAEAMAGARDQLAGQVHRLEAELNELLDKLVTGAGG